MPVFVDTNILVYAEDRSAKGKHEIARELLVRLWDERSGVVSVQVLQEIVSEYLTWTVVANSGKLLTDAIELQQKSKLSFWDSLVVQAAIDAECTALYSEDLSDGQRFGPVVVANPFK